jgi:hypothetical protein
VFARQVWACLLQPAGLMVLTPQPHDEVFEDWWRIASMQVSGLLRKGFNSLVVLGALFGSTGIAVCSMMYPLVCWLFFKWPERRPCSGLWPELKVSPCFRPWEQ